MTISVASNNIQVMLNQKNNKKVYFLIIGLYLFFTAWWLVNAAFHQFRHDSYVLLSEVYGVIALVGGLNGLFISKNLGGRKSYFGKAMILLSLGLLLQEYGQIAYSYLNSIRHVAVPYPSWPDIGFFGSIPVYIIGALYLAKGLGVRAIIKKSPIKLIASLLVAVIIVGTSYWLFLKGYQFSGTPKTTVFFDFGYPLGQAMYVVMALVTLLSMRGLLGGTMRKPVLLLLLAFLIQYSADSNYLYQNIHSTWGPAGYGDYIYMLAYVVMSISLIKLCTPIVGLRKVSSASEKAEAD